MATTVEQLREALPESLRDHVPNSELQTILGGSRFDVTSVNGCTPEEIQTARSRLNELGIIAMPCTECGSDRLISVAFLKR